MVWIIIRWHFCAHAIFIFYCLYLWVGLELWVDYSFVVVDIKCSNFALRHSHFIPQITIRDMLKVKAAGVRSEAMLTA